MKVEYRLLADEGDFEQVGELQRQVFGFSDLELVPPPLLRLVARNNPPLGVHLGAFVTDESGSRLVGAMLGFATFLEKSAYIILLGVLPEYQQGLVGHRLLLQYRETCLARDIRTVYGVYEALNIPLARLYVGGVGLIGTHFQQDKIHFRWDFLSDHTVTKIGGKRVAGLQADDPRPRVSAGSWSDAEEVLYEIPASPSGPGEARLVFEDYVNRRGYLVADCVSSKTEGNRRTFYVLRQPR
jgi:GNAT superfamily N-acetyltransferase